MDTAVTNNGSHSRTTVHQLKSQCWLVV